ncbi:MAG TPA: hypothetical protein PKE47_04935, partial [Verrucomicrobiota bacterium]|nr:hypothetical protein [Verrucomicrobiota bacterium]
MEIGPRTLTDAGGSAFLAVGNQAAAEVKDRSRPAERRGRGKSAQPAREVARVARQLHECLAHV